MTFTEDLRYDYPLRKDSVVIDLGCYHGEFAARIHERYGCHVIGFEPVFHEEAQTKSHGRFRVFPFAVGGWAREDFIRVMDDQTTFHPHVPLELPVQGVTVLPFGPVMALLGIDRIDLLKVNIEGEEYRLLEHLIGWGWLPKIEHLQVQFHDFVPDAEGWRDRLKEKIGETHDIQWDFPWIWTSWRRRP